MRGLRDQVGDLARVGLQYGVRGVDLDGGRTRPLGREAQVLGTDGVVGGGDGGQEGIAFQATAAVGSLPVARAADRCEAASTPARLAVTADMDQPVEAAVEASA
ncbi:hypothetical protein [Streptomyces sp. NWU339]|uniref:hypothetical protein n=1 Tax=Streptomyces sp. NWU339 TaxID=2185284 RepID=UPI0015E80740|nr:hypothetical protein [Streptomyces sp. NWU339]